MRFFEKVNTIFAWRENSNNVKWHNLNKFAWVGTFTFELFRIFTICKVTEVDKREPRESFSKPRPHFWGRGCRPRPRNEQAEAEKCFRDSLFSTEVTEDISNQMWTHFFKDSGKHKNWNRMFFSFVWLFRGVR